ncbi:MAG: class I SAM-dependent methyltransferase [Candidatus Hydrothermarchaeales archaeon]
MAKKSIFDVVAKHYDFFTKILMMGTYGKVQKRIVDSVDDRGGAALDICCGTGYVTGHIKSGNVVGMDLSEGMLGVNRDKNKGKENLLLVKSDAFTMPFRDGTFSAVYCTLAPHEFLNFSPVLKEAYRVMRKGGSLRVYDIYDSPNILVKPFTTFMKYVVEMGKFYIHNEDQWKRKLERLGFEDVQAEILYHASIFLKARK